LLNLSLFNHRRAPWSEKDRRRKKGKLSTPSCRDCIVLERERGWERRGAIEIADGWITLDGGTSL